MFKVTEEMLVLAKQPRKLLTKYAVPAAKVADMIHEATMEMAKREVRPNGTPRDLSRNQYSLLPGGISISRTSTWFALHIGFRKRPI